MQRVGRYEVESELGRGSMGVVYLARDPHVRRRVALKTFLLPPGFTPEQEEEYKERFLREAQAAGALSHPGIVTIYDADTDPDTGVPYIAMELIEGQSLRELLAAKGTLPLDEALAMMEVLAAALAVAHEAGIVHRDIKPGNILVRDRDGAVKIADFGVARLSSSDLTGIGDVFGSPAYMSPEQFRGAVVDARSDLFSLATILYQALSGRRPFRGEDLSSLAYAVVHTVPPPLSSYAPGLSADYDRFFERALAKDPALRFPDGGAFKQALAEVQAGKAPAAPARISDPKASERTVKTHVASSTPSGPPESGRWEGITILEGGFAVSMLLLALLPGLWALWGRSETSPAAGAAAEAQAVSQEDRGEREERRVSAQLAKTGARARPSGRGTTMNGTGAGAGRAGDVTASGKAPGGQGSAKSDEAWSKAHAGAGGGVGAGDLLAGQGRPGEARIAARSGQNAPVSWKKPSMSLKTASPGPGVTPGHVGEGGAGAARGVEQHAAGGASGIQGGAHLVNTEIALLDAPARPAYSNSEGGTGTLLLSAKSSVKQGTLTLLVDGAPVYSRRLASREGEGDDASSLKKWFKRRQESFEIRVEVPAGRHEVVAQVVQDGKESVSKDSALVDVHSSGPCKLQLVTGRLIGPLVSLKAD